MTKILENKTISEYCRSCLASRPAATPRITSILSTYARENETQKLLVVCSYTEKEVPFKAPAGFDLSTAERILQNYPTADGAMKPYEVRVYFWNK